jgi:hypothetical protein
MRDRPTKIQDLIIKLEECNKKLDTNHIDKVDCKVVTPPPPVVDLSTVTFNPPSIINRVRTLK